MATRRGSRGQSPRRDSTAGQGEDFIGAQLALAGAAHAGDLPGGAVALEPHPRALLVELELDVAARLYAERPPNLQRDRDLTLLRHPHAVVLAGNTGPRCGIPGWAKRVCVTCQNERV